MKKITTKIIISIIVVILIIYVIYNVSISHEKKKESYEGNIVSKEKIIATNIRLGIINFDTINPILSKNIDVQNVSRLIFEPLIQVSQDYRLEPCLATEWSKLNKTTYLIKLRENVKWQDGKIFDSDDVIFTINILKDKEINSIYYYNVKDIKSVEKIDEYTIKIITNEEIQSFEYNLIFPIISSKYFNNKNIKLKENNNNPAGTGMYYISNFNNYNITLKKNTNWWSDKELKLDTIELNLYNNINNALTDSKSYNVDLITTSITNIDKYTEGIQCKQITYIGRNYDYLAINCNNDILKNKEVRQAINFAINKEEIIEKVYDNKYIKSEFPLDFGNYLYNKNSQRNEYNTDKAKKILKESNWKYNKNWTKKIKNKNKIIDIEILVNKENNNRIQVADLIKKQLEEIGIKVKVVTKKQKEYIKCIKNKDYDIVLTGTTYGYSPTLNLYFDNNNMANYENEQIIKKIKKMEEGINEEEKRKLISDIINVYNEDVPYISLYFDSITMIYSSNLKGNITPNSYNIFYNIEDWYREYDKK